MPGFVDTHHHQFETALRSFLADGLLFNDGQPHGAINYFEYILGQVRAGVPAAGRLHQRAVRLAQPARRGCHHVHDISQIHHSPEHSDAAIKGMRRLRARVVFGYFESAGAGGSPGQRSTRRTRGASRSSIFSSNDQLLTMIMGGEIYLPGFEHEPGRSGASSAFRSRRTSSAASAWAPTFDALARQRAVQFGPDNLFIHMTGMSDLGWQTVKDAGADVSLAVPIEMNMRHGMPPILKTLDTGIQPSLSVDVECTLTADMFTQMRSAMALQRMSREPACALGEPYAAGFPDLELLTTRDVLRFATQEGANGLKLGSKVGSLTPGKEADIIILDAEAINVAPLNVVPGAVVSLMERSNVETVIVAGKVRKWKGRLLDVNLRKLRQELEDSRDYLFSAAGVPQDLFRPN